METKKRNTHYQGNQKFIKDEDLSSNEDDQDITHYDEQELPHADLNEYGGIYQTNDLRSKSPFNSSEMSNAFNRLQLQQKSDINRSLNFNMQHANQEALGISGSQYDQYSVSANDITSRSKQDINSRQNFDYQNKNTIPYSQEIANPVSSKKLQVHHYQNQSQGGWNNPRLLVDLSSNTDTNSKQNNNYDQEHMMTEQDYEGHQHDEDEQEGSNNDMSNDLSGQEENIPRSDNSLSIENVSANEDDDQDQIDNEYQKYEQKSSKDEQSNASSIVNSSMKCANQDENKKVVVERHERFIIYKMVSLNNKTSAQTSQIHSQPTPVINRQIFDAKNKGYTESVEDINESSDDEPQKIQQKQQDGHFCFDDEDEDMDDEEFLLNEANIVNSQSNVQNQQPVSKQNEKTQVYDMSAKNKPILKLQEMINYQQDSTNQITNTDDQDTRKKSISSSGRSQVDRFSKPHKIEMKKIADDAFDNDMNFTKTIQINVAQVTNNDDKNLKQVEEQRKSSMQLTTSTPQMYDRRQSANTALRTSQIKNDSSEIKQNVQQTKQQHIKESQYNSQIANPKQLDPETQLLKQEYMKLKKTLNKLQNDTMSASGSQTVERSKSKQQIAKSEAVTKTQQKAPKYQAQQKYKKNMQLNMFENNDNHSNIGGGISGQYLSGSSNDEGNNYETGEELYQLHQYRKSLTPTSISKQKAARQQQQQQQRVYQTKETSKIEDGQKKTKALKSQLGSFREAVEANRSKSIRQTAHKDHSKQFNALTQKGSPNRSTAVKSNIQQHSQRANHIRQTSKYNDKKPLQINKNNLSDRSQNKSQRSKKNYDLSVKSRVAYQQKQQVQQKHYASKQNTQRNKSLDSDNDVQNSQDSETYSQEVNYYVQGNNVHSESNSDQQSEDSVEYSDSQESDEDHSCKHSRRHQKKNNKSGKATYNVSKGRSKDRKLKININMNGHQFSRQQQQKNQLSQDDYMHQQRHLIQQQQYMMQMAQYPAQQSQAILLQQQQQQQVYQQHIPVQQPLNIVYQGLPTQPHMMNNYLISNHSVAQIQPQTTVNEQKQNIIFFGGLSNNGQQLPQSTSTSVLNNIGPRNNDQYTSRENRQIGKNLSGKSLLSQIGQNNAQNKNINEASEKYTHQKQNLSIQNYISPREHSLQNYHQDSSQQATSQKQQYQNLGPDYLHHLKNRFKASNQNSEAKTNFGSRNMSQQIQQNRSSPPKNDGEFTNWPSAQDYNNYEKSKQNQIGGQPDRIRQQYNQQHNKRSSFMDSEHEEDKVDFNFYNKQRSTNSPKNDDYLNQQAKITGQFANVRGDLRQNNSNQHLKTKRSRDESAKNDRDSCSDMSMDEGVKVGNAHDSIMWSPKTSTAHKQMYNDSQTARQSDRNASNVDLYSQKEDNININNKRISNQLQYDNQGDQKSKHNQDKLDQNIQQDKKSPQAIFIGFEETVVKDPFSKKPALKQRQERQVSSQGIKNEKAQTLIERSKSAKGASLQRSETQKQSQKEKEFIIMDKQIKSPAAILDSDRLSTFKKSSSPLKQVVSNLKQKQDDFSILPIKDQQTNTKKDPTEFELDPSDPSHNQAIVIEIFDKKVNSQSKPKEEISLADMFKKKKRDIIEKLDHRKQGEQDQDDQGQDDIQQVPNVYDQKQRTKKEILEQRKQMMKSQVKTHLNNFEGAGANQDSKTTKSSTNLSKPPLDNSSKNKKEPSGDLMQRLAMGQKTKVDRQEMKKLTNKNFQKLPEQQKKKDDEKKKEELQARKNAAQDYAKKLEQKRRTNILKKQKSQQFEEC